MSDDHARVSGMTPGSAKGMRYSPLTEDQCGPYETALEALDCWTFTLPFAVGVADNRRTGVLNGRVLLTRRYREAKEAAAAFAMRERTRLGIRSPLAGSLALTARVWLPDRRRRDVGNMRKLLTDAMKGIWYDDDQQLWRETWERSTTGGRRSPILATRSAGRRRA